MAKTRNTLQKQISQAATITDKLHLAFGKHDVSHYWHQQEKKQKEPSQKQPCRRPGPETIHDAEMLIMSCLSPKRLAGGKPIMKIPEWDTPKTVDVLVKRSSIEKRAAMGWLFISLVQDRDSEFFYRLGKLLCKGPKKSFQQDRRQVTALFFCKVYKCGTSDAPCDPRSLFESLEGRKNYCGYGKGTAEIPPQFYRDCKQWGIVLASQRPGPRQRISHK